MGGQMTLTFVNFDQEALFILPLKELQAYSVDISMHFRIPKE